MGIEGPISFNLIENLSVGRFHHIGVATSNIENSRDLFTSIGFHVESEEIRDQTIDVKVQFLVNDSVRIELVEPVGEESPAHVWLNVGSPIYHFGFMADSSEESAQILKSLKFKKIYGPVPAVAFDGQEVEFYMNKNRLVLEIISRKSLQGDA